MSGEMTMDAAIPSSSLWFDQLAEDGSWSELWKGYILCGSCRGIRSTHGACDVCGDAPSDFKPSVIRDNHGNEHLVYPVSMGAEGRYEDWVYLRMMEREWKRPLLSDEPSPEMSPRASIVILFWSYFETRIDRLFREALRDAPGRIIEDALRRYSAIGARLNDFYKIAFDSTYKKDLEVAGFGDLWAHLSKVQERRNEFAHGQPQAIDDALVRAVVEKLKLEHEAWIAVFNRRAARVGSI
jgi:hypothetical protein